LIGNKIMYSKTREIIFNEAMGISCSSMQRFLIESECSFMEGKPSKDSPKVLVEELHFFFYLLSSLRGLRMTGIKHSQKFALKICTYMLLMHSHTDLLNLF
jgi:hypothetical protein